MAMQSHSAAYIAENRLLIRTVQRHAHDWRITIRFIPPRPMRAAAHDFG